MEKQFLSAVDLSKLLGVSRSKAYAMIHDLNVELSNRGFLTVRGKIPAAFVEERFFGIKASKVDGGE